jgi:hypothetical protein
MRKYTSDWSSPAASMAAAAASRGYAMSSAAPRLAPGRALAPGAGHRQLATQRGAPRRPRSRAAMRGRMEGGVGAIPAIGGRSVGPVEKWRVGRAPAGEGGAADSRGARDRSALGTRDAARFMFAPRGACLPHGSAARPRVGVFAAQEKQCGEHIARRSHVADRSAANPSWAPRCGAAHAVFAPPGGAGAPPPDPCSDLSSRAAAIGARRAGEVRGTAAL